MSWMPIDSAPVWDKVDIWMQWGASATTMGWGDSFRVPDAYQKPDGTWWHYDHGEKQLRKEYITHWMPLPSAPETPNDPQA